MDIWANSVITQNGHALQAKLLTGTTLKITRAVSGAGYVTPGLLLTQEAVTDEKQTLSFKPFSYTDDGQVAVPVRLENADLATGYTAMQIGIYAIDPDKGEILYLISQSEVGKGTEVPSNTESPGYSAEWTFYFKYGQADSVDITVDLSNAVTHEELNKYVADTVPKMITDGINDTVPTMITKEIDEAVPAIITKIITESVQAATEADIDAAIEAAG